MRRVCGFDTLSAHLVRKSLSLSLSVALGVLPMAPAFGRDDDRYSYTANNRYQDFQNQYKPQKNYSLTSQLDRQIQTQNTALQFRFGQRMETKTPTFAFSQSNKPSLPQPQFQFGIQTRKAVEAYKLDAPRPEAMSRWENRGMVGTIANVFKATFRAIGTAIGKVVGFFTVDRARVTAEVQRDRVLKENPGLRAVSPGVFQVPAGQTAQHGGRTWEAGSTFQMNADGRGIALTEGVTMSPDLGGIRRADGNPLPVKMVGENGGFKPIGIDFARVEPKTSFNFTQPVEMEGLGRIPAGASMTYEAMKPGTKEDPTPTVVLSFQNARIINPQGALEALGKGKEPVTLGQMEMRLKGAINQISGLYVNRGGEKIYTSQYGEAFSVTQLEKKSAAARYASSALVQKSKKLTDDVTSATLHSKMLMGRLHEQTGTPATVDFQVKTPVTAQAQATKALVRKTDALAQHMAEGNYTQVANAITEVERAQGEQLKGIEGQQAQVEIFQQYKRAVKGLEQAYGQLAAQADPASMKAPGETKETLTDAAPYFKKEKNEVQIQVGNALKALNAMEAQGIITPTENLLKATEIKVIRDHLLSAKPDLVGKAVIKTADAMEKNYQAVSQDVGEAVFDPMYKMAEKYPKTMQAVGQGALALAGGAAIVGLGYGMATAPATTAVVVGSGVISQKTFEAMGLSPEAAAFYTAIALAPIGAVAEKSSVLKTANKDILTEIVHRIGIVVDWFRPSQPVARSLGAAAKAELANQNTQYEIVRPQENAELPTQTSPKTIELRVLGKEAAPIERAFKGLGDARTSPWLKDGRAGVRAHLEEFRNGGSFLIKKSTYDRLVRAGDPIGREDGLFITTREAMDKLFQKTNGQMDLIKKGLGIPPTSWNEPVLRIDVFNPLLHDAHMASGFERGANELFIWGGYTKGGMPEIAINSVAAGEYTVVGEIK